jgi:hypothetical protein
MNNTQFPFFISFSLLPPYLSLPVLHYTFNISFVGGHLIIIKFYTVNKIEQQMKNNKELMYMVVTVSLCLSLAKLIFFNTGAGGHHHTEHAAVSLISNLA